MIKKSIRYEDKENELLDKSNETYFKGNNSKYVWLEKLSKLRF